MKLTTIPHKHTLEEWITHLKEQPSASAAFSLSMDYPKGLLKVRIGNLALDGQPVSIMPYSTQEDCDILTDALKQFEPAYNPDIRT
eukprot:10047428-Ditylum_brightwellii.AAC.1